MKRQGRSLFIRENDDGQHATSIDSLWLHDSGDNYLDIHLPTVVESGLPGVVSETAFVLVAPAGTPSPVVERLSAHSAAIMADPEFQRALQASAIEAVQVSDPARARQFLEREYTKWAPVVREVLGR